jgi:3-hydroxyisobutyrate dehydrogenase-like beta-hydroxyacid dehydrogenase
MISVGVIGLGAMGSRLAGRLLDEGYVVYGTNRTRAKAEGLIERGLVWRESPRDVADCAELVISMVTGDAALEAIAAGADGLLAGLRTGQVYIDMSTVSPETSRRLADRVREHGAQMLDAPVSGSIPQAESGTLAIMVGGDGDTFAVAEPVLRVLGQAVTHIGPAGQGLVVKLAINISLAVQTLAFSEGLLLDEHAGVDPEIAAAAMSTSSIGSPMLKARVPLLLHLPEHAWFDIELMQKDVRLALRSGRDLQISLPSAAIADEMLTRARDLGYGHRDLASLHEVLERTPAALE